VIKKSEPKKKIDLGVIFESTLLGVFVLIGRYFNTLYLFTKKPAIFFGALDSSGQSKAIKKFSIVRPLTFLTISLGLLIAADLAVIRARGNSVQIHNYEIGDGFNLIFLFMDALKSFDIQKIVLALSPWALLTGLFAYTLTRSAQGRGFVFSFEKSVGLSSYFCGSAACALMAPAPLITYLYLKTDFGRNVQTEQWVALIWLSFSALLGVRYFHAYLSVLRAELGTSMKTSLLVWVGGLWRFVLGYIVISNVVMAILTPFLSVAENKWRPLAEQGNADAQYKLGEAYDDGLGVRHNAKEAVLWYRRAAELGHAKAQNRLGFAYEKGRGISMNDAEAVKWYRKAAEQGDAIAQSNLGYMYANGRGTTKSDQEAVKWYRKAAEQGNASAQNDLGVAYSNGRGVPQNYEEAVKWFRYAANQGDYLAQSNLGVVYYLGRGVRQNYAEAVVWFRKAAEQGYAKAQTNLGISYAKGQGVPQNNVLAYMLYSIAATTGDKEASQNRDLLQQQMTPAEVAKGRNLAAKWNPGEPLPTSD
jgi:uncharacterized protein